MIENTSPSVVIVLRYLPHYRLKFFQSLVAVNPDLYISVFHSGWLGKRGLVQGFSVKKFKLIKLSLLGYKILLQPGLFWEIVSQAPDVVVLEGTFGVLSNMLILIWRRMIGKTTLYWAAGWDNPEVTGGRLKLKSLAVRFLISSAHGGIAYGSVAKKYLMNHGMAADAITVAQNTIDVDTIMSDLKTWRTKGKDLRGALLPAAYPVLVFVGQITVLKKLDILLDAYKLLVMKYPQIALLVVGDGPALADVKSLAREYKLTGVHFVGEVVEGVEAYISAGDVFVLPGAGGLALNQAMALGLPLVTTVADGTQEDLIENGRNGYIVSEGEANLLVEAIQKIVDDPMIREEMGNVSLQVIKDRASFHNMVAKFSGAIRAFI